MKTKNAVYTAIFTTLSIVFSFQIVFEFIQRIISLSSVITGEPSRMYYVAIAIVAVGAIAFVLSVAFVFFAKSRTSGKGVGIFLLIIFLLVVIIQIAALYFNIELLTDYCKQYTEYCDKYGYGSSDESIMESVNLAVKAYSTNIKNISVSIAACCISLIAYVFVAVKNIRLISKETKEEYSVESHI